MRKMKKINGYLIVRFNDRERREYEELGAFGVIDAEVYTGSIDIDRGEMEYDDAETIEQAVEQARGLDSEEDYTNAKPTYTVAAEEQGTLYEAEFNPEWMIAEMDRQLRARIDDRHYPDVDHRTATHELYGFMVVYIYRSAIV